MDNEIDIENVAGTLYYSTIRRGMFCEPRIKRHGLMRIDSGRLVVESPDFHFEAGAGAYVFWRRDCTASLKKLPDGGEPFRSIALNLSRDFLKGYFAERLSQHRLPSRAVSLPVPAMQLGNSERLEEVFGAFDSYRGRGGEFNEALLEEKMNAAVECLLTADERFYPTLFDFYETWKIDLLDFMEHHFTEDMSISDFASYTGRSLATFKRDFEKISTLPPEKWIMEQRLVLARHLMRESGLKPKEAFMATGFKNRSHFSASFKRRFGCSPSQMAVKN